ncbi:hypothetical protein SAMD00079811_52240 [Scytonema sp. HK-05]|nr:hypothetical protein SAMD00079811_52240 [Scytonema sp. HK-05]
MREPGNEGLEASPTHCCNSCKISRESDYNASRLDEVIIYLCPSVSICGFYFLMYCTQLPNRYIAILTCIKYIHTVGAFV